jgi:hypothetical protein
MVPPTYKSAALPLRSPAWSNSESGEVLPCYSWCDRRKEGSACVLWVTICSLANASSPVPVRALIFWPFHYQTSNGWNTMCHMAHTANGLLVSVIQGYTAVCAWNSVQLLRDRSHKVLVKDKCIGWIQLPQDTVTTEFIKTRSWTLS